MPRKSNTKRANGSGTIRKRKDGTWEARYTARIDTGSGKQIQRSLYSKSHDDIRKKLVEVSSHIDTGIYIDPVKLTVRQWADLWLKEYVGAVKETTKEQYLYQIEEHIKPAIGAVKLTAVTAPMIQKMYNFALYIQHPFLGKTGRRNSNIIGASKGIVKVSLVFFCLFPPAVLCK